MNLLACHSYTMYKERHASELVTNASLHGKSGMKLFHGLRTVQYQSVGMSLTSERVSRPRPSDEWGLAVGSRMLFVSGQDAAI